MCVGQFPYSEGPTLYISTGLAGKVHMYLYLKSDICIGSWYQIHIHLNYSKADFVSQW